MSDFLNDLKALKRPRLLIRAARFGLDGYHRDQALSRLIAPRAYLSHRAALERLLDAEEQINSQRKARHVEYQPSRHIELLTAIMAEAMALNADRAA